MIRLNGRKFYPSLLKMPLRHEFVLCFVAVGQVIGLSLLFLGTVGNLEPALTIEDDGENVSKQKTGDLSSNGMPNRVVLMVVDALRVDMMTPSNFPFLLNSLRNHKKTGLLMYNVTVDSPTVTLPRVKTLMTGRAPTYLDILKNLQTSDNSLSSNQLVQNNLIQLLRQGRPDLNICFFGDETWLRLFPPELDGRTSTFFYKWEGVTSFFVKDFDEVDRNVSRNLNDIEDCHFLILHYLGLDHIGHVHGPTERPDLIQRKLKEMDKVIQKLYYKLSKDNNDLSHKSLLLVTGDHGMANAGGHGGSSFEEITTPLAAIISGVPHMRNIQPVVSSIHQVDIAPSLATLWRLPIPKESHGKIILDIVESFQSSQELATTYEDNCEHLMKMLGESTQVAATYRLWLNEISKLEKPLSVTKYVELENELFLALQSLKQERSQISGPYVFGVIILIGVEIIMVVLVSGMLSEVWTDVNYAIGLSLLPPLCVYFSSSFIEEEHYIRYFMFSSVLMASYCCNVSVDFRSAWSLVKVLFYHRLLTSLNQTGDKWSHYPDLNDTIMKENLTWVSSLIGTFLIWRFLTYSDRSSKVGFVALFFTYGAKVLSSSDIPTKMWPFTIVGEVGLQQLTFGMILVNFLVTLWRKSIKESVFVSVMLIVLHLQRLQNVLVVGLLLTGLLETICLYHHQQVLRMESQANARAPVPLSTQVAFVWFTHAAFFYQGNSNGLATIDVSAGYIGFGSFASSFLIGLLIFLNTYGNPLIVYLHFATIRSDNSNVASATSSKHLTNGLTNSRSKGFYQHKISYPLPVMSLFSNGLECIIYSITLVLFHNHLFIWSVFVPKLIYLISQSVMHFILSITYLML